MPDQDGTVVTLESLRGHWVACGGTRWRPPPVEGFQGGGFRDRTPEFEEAGAVVLGVSSTPSRGRSLCRRPGVFPTACWPTLTGPWDGVRRRPVGNGFARRTTYLIDPEGTIVRTYDLRGEDLEAHAGVVLDDIRAPS
ncbi:MAG: hypothetical protein Ct9H300mP31_15920 [Acidimicrobiaceae bacterium]|nr:MAG: hypothetical protein Ct9H300mP31_15920 [Acidimicrobiaceae bacterium]